MSQSAGTKLKPETLAEAEEVIAATGLSMADILRIGLSRVLDEYAETGRIEVRPRAEAANESEAPVVA